MLVKIKMSLKYILHIIMNKTNKPMPGSTYVPAHLILCSWS